MSEKKLVVACMAELERALPRVWLWKIADYATGGVPDLEVNWGGFTTKLEFKYLKGNETIHDKWADGRQLITAVRLEETTGRCWIVAYRKKDVDREAQTIIYRPSALLNLKIPHASVFCFRKNEQWVTRLWDEGCVMMTGFDHPAIASLIVQTHQ